MKGAMIRCVRCKGRKKLFKVSGAYTYTDTGGKEIDCPMCLGSGQVKSLEDALDEIKVIKKKSDKAKEKDSKNGQERIEAE